MDKFGFIFHNQCIRCGTYYVKYLLTWAEYRITSPMCALAPAQEIASSFHTVPKLLLHFPPRKVLIQQTIVISAFSHASAEQHTRKIQELLSCQNLRISFCTERYRNNSRIPHPLSVLGRLLLVLPAHVVVQLAAFLQVFEFCHELPGRLINVFSMIVNHF